MEGSSEGVIMPEPEDSLSESEKCEEQESEERGVEGWGGGGRERFYPREGRYFNTSVLMCICMH